MGLGSWRVGAVVKIIVERVEEGAVRKVEVYCALI